MNSSRSAASETTNGGDNVLEHRSTCRSAHGGMAFDYFLDNGQQTSTAEEANLRSGGDVGASLHSSSDMTSGSSELTNLTLTKRFEMRKAAAAAAAAARKKTPSQDLDVSSSSTLTASSLASPKYSTVSLGAKIAEKARQNMISTNQIGPVSPSSPSFTQSRRGSENSLGLNITALSSTAPLQYTNRTLHLRQESARAKRDSLEKSSNKRQATNGIVGKKQTGSSNSSTGGLNKSSSSVLSSATPLARATSSTAGKMNTSGSKASSRSNSQTRMGHTAAHTNPLMTGSLNLSAGLMPNDPFQRRKMYDPMRAVEMDRLKRQQQQQQQNKLSNMNTSNGAKRANGSFDKLYDAINSSFANSDSGDDENSRLDCSFANLSIDTTRVRLFSRLLK